MRIKALAAQHFRSLENVVMSDLQQSNVLIGRNNAGKSNIFRAMETLSKSAQGLLDSDPRILTAFDPTRSFCLRLTAEPSQAERQQFIETAGRYASLDDARLTALEAGTLLRTITYSFATPPHHPHLLHLREVSITTEADDQAVVQRLTGSDTAGNPEHHYVSLGVRQSMRTTGRNRRSELIIRLVVRFRRCLIRLRSGRCASLRIICRDAISLVR
jgi:hypothetical protein